MNIENENRNPKSNLKMENENQNREWNFENAIGWIWANGYCLEAMSALLSFVKYDVSEIKTECANYKATLNLISKITRDGQTKEIVRDTLSGKQHRKRWENDALSAENIRVKEL